MDPIVAALAAQQDELDGILRDATDAAWDAPTRCPGWAVSDVVLHLAQTDELALASVEDRIAEAAAGWTGAGEGGTVDDLAGAFVAQQRGVPPQQVLERWQAAARAVRDAFDTVDPSARLTWVAGQLSARTLATTVRGPAMDFCEVAARRLDPADSGLTATGPDAEDVLALVRTYA